MCVFNQTDTNIFRPLLLSKLFQTSIYQPFSLTLTNTKPFLQSNECAREREREIERRERKPESVCKFPEIFFLKDFGIKRHFGLFTFNKLFFRQLIGFPLLLKFLGNLNSNKSSKWFDLKNNKRKKATFESNVE